MVLSIIFRQLRRRPSIQGRLVWKAPGIRAGTVQEVLCPPSRPQDSRVKYGEGGPRAQVTWNLNTWSLTNRPPSVLATWTEMQKRAPRTGHQGRSPRAALLCKRAQFAPNPGGISLALSEDAASILMEPVDTKIDLEDASAVRKVTQSWVGTKLVARWSDFAGNIDMDAVKTATRTNRDKKEINIKRNAKGEKIPGGMNEDSTGLKGAMFNKDVTRPKTKRMIENPRILLPDYHPEYKQGESRNNIKIKKRDDVSKILGQEEMYLKKDCAEITAFKPDRVITEKGVSDMAQYFFHGDMTVRRLRKSNNMRVAKAYGPPIANRTDEITEEDIGTRAGLFEVRKTGDEYVTSIEQCKDPKARTNLLRGASKDVLKEVERAKAEAKAAEKEEAEDDIDLDDIDEEEEEEIKGDTEEEAEPKKGKPHQLEREKDVRQEAAGVSMKMRKRTRRTGKRKRRKTKRLQILFWNRLSQNYISVEQGKLRGYTKARLKGFYEEEMDGLLERFEKVADHVLRIARIVRQPHGHLLLPGASGAGKTTLSRSDCADGKRCFILDESNVMDSGFLERMNTKLTKSEGKEGAQRQGPRLDTNQKGSGLEEEQLHINVGLDKSAKTGAQGE